MEAYITLLPTLVVLIMAVALVAGVIILGREFLTRENEDSAESIENASERQNARARELERLALHERMDVLSRINEVDTCIIKYKKAISEHSRNTPFEANPTDQAITEVAELLALPRNTTKDILDNFPSISVFLSASDAYIARALTISLVDAQEVRGRIWKQLDPTNIASFAYNKQHHG